MRLKPLVSAIIFLRFIRFRLNLHAAEAGGVSEFSHSLIGWVSAATRVDSKTPTSSKEPAGVLASSIFRVYGCPALNKKTSQAQRPMCNGESVVRLAAISL